MAEDLIDGTVCSECSCVYFETHGHPVVCSGCWNEMTPKERQGHVKAYNKCLMG